MGTVSSVSVSTLVITRGMCYVGNLHTLSHTSVRQVWTPGQTRRGTVSLVSRPAWQTMLRNGLYQWQVTPSASPFTTLPSLVDTDGQLWLFVASGDAGWRVRHWDERVGGQGGGGRWQGRNMTSRNSLWLMIVSTVWGYVCFIYYFCLSLLISAIFFHWWSKFIKNRDIVRKWHKIGTSGFWCSNRDCPAEIGTVGMSVQGL